MTVSHHPPPPSRVFVGTQVTALAALPFAPPAPARGGEGLVAHRLLASCGWSQDAQSFLVSCLDLALTFPPGLAAPPPPPAASVAEVAAWRAPARVVAAAATAPAPGAALLVAACADGSLCRLRLRVPTAPGAGVEDAGLIDDGGADHDGDALVPWRPRAHAGAATAVDVGASGVVVSGGADGAIVATRADAWRGNDDGAATVVAPRRPTAAVLDVRWLSATDVAAVSAGGGVELWDARRGSDAARPAARAPPPPSPASCPVRLAVTPARPHAIAVGMRDGTVALLDVRALGKGAMADAALAGGGRPEGPVTALVFDPLPTLGDGAGGAGSGGGAPPLLFTTGGGGALASARLASAGETAALLFREPAGGATALALDGGGVDAVVATAHEGLVHLSRRG